MEDKRAYRYRYISSSSKWGFVPIPDSDMGTEDVKFRPIETWITTTGAIVTLKDVTYSIKTVKEMICLEEKRDDRDIVFPPNTSSINVMVCIAEKKSEPEDVIVCKLYINIKDNHSVVTTLTSYDKSRGTGPRFGDATVLSSIDTIKNKIKATADLDVTNREIHEKDWQISI